MPPTTDSTGDFPDVFGQASLAAPFQRQDLSAMKTLLDQINVSGGNVSRTLASGFASASLSGKSFNDTLASIAQTLAKTAIKAGAQSLGEGLVAGLGLTALRRVRRRRDDRAFRRWRGGREPDLLWQWRFGWPDGRTRRGSDFAAGARGERPARGRGARRRRESGVGDGEHSGARRSRASGGSEAQITGALARAVARGQRNL